MEITDGVYTYRGRPGDKVRPGAGSSTVTVVRGDGLLMIDAGVVAGGAFRDLASRMREDGLDPKDVRRVVFTHAHWDHLNAAGKIISLSRAQTAALRPEVPFIEDKKKNFAAFVPGFAEFAKEIFPFPMPLARLLVRYAWGAQPKLAVTKVLADGDVIDVGRKVRAVSIPGHTDGHTGYFVEDAGVLAGGDLIDFENSGGMDLNNPRSSYGSALSSIERVIDLAPEVFIPGHGEPVVGRRKVREMLEAALIGGLEYPATIKAVLGARPMRLKDILRAAFPGTPFSMEAMTMMLILVVLLHMEKEGEVTRVEKGGRPAWVIGG